MTGRKKKVDFNTINRVMNHLPDYSKNKLICITNGKEVLRITRKSAKEYFFKRIAAKEDILKIKKQLGFEVNIAEGYYYSASSEWFYTTKTIYKQYCESLKPGSKIPAPKFTTKIMNEKGEEKIVNTHIYSKNHETKTQI